MSGKTQIYMILAAFAAIFLFEWFYHGILLMPFYEATSSIWRPMSEMQQMMPFCLLTKLLRAGVFTWLFICHLQSNSQISPLRYGFYLGLLIGVVELSAYMYLPVPPVIPAAWLAGHVIIGVLLGFILPKFHKQAPSA